jgi:hypothetical protein
VAAVVKAEAAQRCEAALTTAAARIQYRCKCRAKFFDTLQKKMVCRLLPSNKTIFPQETSNPQIKRRQLHIAGDGNRVEFSLTELFSSRWRPHVFLWVYVPPLRVNSTLKGLTTNVKPFILEFSLHVELNFTTGIYHFTQRFRSR